MIEEAFLLQGRSTATSAFLQMTKIIYPVTLPDKPAPG
jgi:hypothetical protein